jgi:uncharacterized protein YodC (DUF2158 family)
MKTKLKTGDKVVKKGTIEPIMKVEGNTMKPSFPEYKALEDTYTCSWITLLGKEYGEFRSDELETVF